MHLDIYITFLVDFEKTNLTRIVLQKDWQYWNFDKQFWKGRNTKKAFDGRNNISQEKAIYIIPETITENWKRPKHTLPVYVQIDSDQIL